MHRYAKLTAIATFLLLIAGGLVTSTDSGLAVPDWPLSYGMFFPPMVGGIAYEHGHRMIAALVGVMILALALWLCVAESRPWVRRLGYAALIAVAIQALLGGLTVRLMLPPAVSIAHACLGQTVFCLIVAVAYATSPSFEQRSDGGAATLQPLGMVVAALAAAQLLLGAMIRHTGYGVMWHLSGAGALLAALIVLSVRAKRVAGRTAPWFRHIRRLHALVGSQILIGLLVYTHRASVPLRTAHVALGALVLAQSVILAWDLHRS